MVSEGLDHHALLHVNVLQQTAWILVSGFWRGKFWSPNTLNYLWCY
jgi:hypothetical protein